MEVKADFHVGHFDIYIQFQRAGRYTTVPVARRVLYTNFDDNNKDIVTFSLEQYDNVISVYETVPGGEAFVEYDYCRS